MRKLYIRIIVIVLSMSSGFLFSQLPTFFLLYKRVLSGSVLEANRSLKSFERMANLNNKTLKQYINKHIKSRDPDFHGTGIVMAEMLERRNSYSILLAKCHKSSVLMLPLILLPNLDYKILQSIHFKFDLRFGKNDLIYFIFGCMIGYIFIMLGYIIFNK